MIDDFGVNSAKRTFKGYSEEHRKRKLNEFISFSEETTVSCRFPVDSVKTFEGIKIPQRKQDCLDSDNGKTCSDDVIKPKMNCFICEMERSCMTCSDRIGQKKTYSTNINTLKRKPANEYYQMLPYYEREYEPKQNNINFESAREILKKRDFKKLMKRRFERIYNMMECRRYMKTKIFRKTKRYFIVDSNILKLIKTIIIDYSGVTRMSYMKTINCATSGLIKS